MIRSLMLENYRGFRHFEMTGLGRVNLIVGANNAGKTSILEAIHIVEATGDLSSIRSTLTRRGEDSEEREDESVHRQVNVRRLFNGHEIQIGKSLQIVAQTDRGTDSFRASFAELEKNSEPRVPRTIESSELTFEPQPFSGPASLEFHWKAGHSSVEINVTFNPASRRDSLRGRRAA